MPLRKYFDVKLIKLDLNIKFYFRMYYNISYKNVKRAFIELFI